MYKRIVLISLSSYVIVDTWNEKAVMLFLVVYPYKDIAFCMLTFFWGGRQFSSDKLTIG